MHPSELVARMVRVEGDALCAAMIKAAALMQAPRAPTLSSGPSAGVPRMPTLRHTAPQAPADQTRPETIAPQKSIAPPAI